MMKKILPLCMGLFCLIPALARARSFDDLYPQLDRDTKAAVFAPKGVIFSVKKAADLRFLPSPGLEIDISVPDMKKPPVFFAESLMVIPYSSGGKQAERLDLYNALRKIRNLKGRLYHSYSKDEYVPLFEDATRIEGPKNTNAIGDPPAAGTLPQTESVYIRLKDTNFGNSYYRADIKAMPHGISYRLANFRSLSYLFFTVMKEEKFVAQIYLEPLSEGVLVYSVAGTEVSDFIASKISISSAITKRLEVILGWINDGIMEIR